MENSIYLALSKQLVLQDDMQIIANNIANMNTSGYRAQNLLFEEYISDPRGKTTDKGAKDELSFVYDRGQYENTAPGSLRFTGNALDAAIEGPGFFGVNGPDGEIMYTRSGEFQKSVDGTLVTTGGYAVAGTGGGPIIIPDGSSEIVIGDDGSVSNQDGQIGQLMLVEFENPQLLEPYGEQMYRSPVEGQPSQNSVVKQAELEGSNVIPVIEMTRMIETLRNFQANQNILQTENERLRSAIQKLTGQG